MFYFNHMDSAERGCESDRPYESSLEPVSVKSPILTSSVGHLKVPSSYLDDPASFVGHIFSTCGNTLCLNVYI